MYTLAADFESRAALAVTLSPGGIFVPGVYYVPLGAAVLVRITVRELPGEILFAGAVQSRRLRGAAQPGLPAGIGVQPRADQQARFEFLRAWAAGASEHSGRREPRFPADVPGALRRAGGGVFAARAEDVSAHGATLATEAGVVAGERVAFEAVLRGVPRSLPARVAWARGGRAGLRLLLDSPDEQVAWERVTDAARDALFARLLAPGEVRGDASGEGAADKRLEPATGAGRSDRARAIETLQRILSEPGSGRKPRP